MKHRFITFLTDFGLADDFVGTCHGVIKRLAPDVEIIDITHGIPPQAVLQGALVLRNTIPYMPEGVHLAVVDPGVGSSRRPLVLRDAVGRLYVGPDNGLLVPAAETNGIESAHELANPEYALESVSRTFHGRDLFAPAAAHLALGVDPAELGPPLGLDALVRLDLPVAEVGAGVVRAAVLYVDRFGNMQLNLTREDLDSVGIAPGNALRARGQRRALLRDRRAYVRGRAAGRDRPLRGLVSQHRDRDQPRQRGRDVLVARRATSDAAPERAVNWGQRFARLATDVVVRQPALWRLFRRATRKQFDKLAPVWDARRDPAAFAPVSRGAGHAAGAAAPRARPRHGDGIGRAARERALSPTRRSSASISPRR